MPFASRWPVSELIPFSPIPAHRGPLKALDVLDSGIEIWDANVVTFSLMF